MDQVVGRVRGQHVADATNASPRRTALLVCGECDMTAQFDIGPGLVIRGLDAYLDTAKQASAASAR
ncbi:hypothetical protein [Amycolatopsis acididurans]|uniref:hypothetical protein n=1 Tax=Amycolatopsis acididurans TaxID=2724524 RepID=UPI001B320DBC|nr:hypothetical protein [Amycolatopsis acididurans]